MEEINSMGSRNFSLSPSKFAHQRVDSHIKSVLPNLQGKNDSKFINVYIHNSFIDQK